MTTSIADMLQFFSADFAPAILSNAAIGSPQDIVFLAYQRVAHETAKAPFNDPSGPNAPPVTGDHATEAESALALRHLLDSRDAFLAMLTLSDELAAEEEAPTELLTELKDLLATGGDLSKIMNGLRSSATFAAGLFQTRSMLAFDAVISTAVTLKEKEASLLKVLRLHEMSMFAASSSVHLRGFQNAVERAAKLRARRQREDARYASKFDGPVVDETVTSNMTGLGYHGPRI